MEMDGMQARSQFRTHTVCVVVVITGMIAVSVQSGVAPDSSVLVDELMTQQRSLPPYAFHTETQMSWQAGEEQGGERHSCQTYFDGGRVDVSTDRYTVDGETSVSLGSTRAIWDGTQYLFRSKLNTRATGEAQPLQADR